MAKSIRLGVVARLRGVEIATSRKTCSYFRFRARYTRCRASNRLALWFPPSPALNLNPSPPVPCPRPSLPCRDSIALFSAIDSDTTGVSIVWRTSHVQLSGCKRCLVAYHSAQDHVFSRIVADEEEER